MNRSRALLLLSSTALTLLAAWASAQTTEVGTPNGNAVSVTLGNYALLFSPIFSGIPQAPAIHSSGTNSQIATAYDLGLYAPLAGPDAFTGSITVPDINATGTLSAAVSSDYLTYYLAQTAITGSGNVYGGTGVAELDTYSIKSPTGGLTLSGNGQSIILASPITGLQSVGGVSVTGISGVQTAGTFWSEPTVSLSAPVAPGSGAPPTLTPLFQPIGAVVSGTTNSTGSGGSFAAGDTLSPGWSAAGITCANLTTGVQSFPKIYVGGGSNGGTAPVSGKLSTSNGVVLVVNTNIGCSTIGTAVNASGSVDLKVVDSVGGATGTINVESGMLSTLTLGTSTAEYSTVPTVTVSNITGGGVTPPNGFTVSMNPASATVAGDPPSGDFADGSIPSVRWVGSNVGQAFGGSSGAFELPHGATSLEPTGCTNTGSVWCIRGNDTTGLVEVFNPSNNAWGNYVGTAGGQKYALNNSVTAGLWIRDGFGLPDISLIETTGGLFKISNSYESSVGAPVAGNVGNDTIGSVSAQNTAAVGVYTITMTSSTAFTVTNPGTVQIGTGAVGTAFSAGGVNFTITAGTTADASGDKYTVTIASAPRVVLSAAENDTTPLTLSDATGVNLTGPLNTTAVAADSCVVAIDHKGNLTATIVSGATCTPGTNGSPAPTLTITASGGGTATAVQALSTAPTSPAGGTVYFNTGTTTPGFFGYNGSAFVPFAVGTTCTLYYNNGTAALTGTLTPLSTSGYGVADLVGGGGGGGKGGTFGGTNPASGGGGGGSAFALRVEGPIAQFSGVSYTIGAVGAASTGSGGGAGGTTSMALAGVSADTVFSYGGGGGSDGASGTTAATGTSAGGGSGGANGTGGSGALDVAGTAGAAGGVAGGLGANAGFDPSLLGSSGAGAKYDGTVVGTSSGTMMAPTGGGAGGSLVASATSGQAGGAAGRPSSGANSAGGAAGSGATAGGNGSPTSLTVTDNWIGWGAAGGGSNPTGTGGNGGVAGWGAGGGGGGAGTTSGSGSAGGGGAIYFCQHP